MFDDHNQVGAGGQTPQNLPFVDEPDDMFSGTDAAPPSPVAPSAAPQVAPAMPDDVPAASAPPASPTALGAGVLKPKAPSAPGPMDAMPVAPGSETVDVPVQSPPASAPRAPQIPEIPQGNYDLKEPSLSRGIMTFIIVIVVIVIIGGGGWWIYASFVKDQNVAPGFGQVSPTPQVDVVDPGFDEGVIPVYDVVDSPGETPVDTDELILFGEPIDTDGDGLDDVRESDLGTDPRNWDSDADNLSDGDEVIIWKTDPRNPDTDGDSYGDGEEVKGGYNPAGPGKFFEPPPADEEVVNDDLDSFAPVDNTVTLMDQLREEVGDIGTCTESQYELAQALVFEQLRSQETAGVPAITDATYTDPATVDLIRTQLATFGCVDA